jgi:formylglycine-generating enzyme required for sulfatase activity
MLSWTDLSQQRSSAEAIALFAAAALILTGCSGGLTGDDTSGELEQDLGANTADYLLLDLESGSLSTKSGIDNIADDSYRDRYLLFKALPAGSITLGQAADTFGRQEDELQSNATVGRFYLAAFECSQAQWQRLAGSTPWDEIPSEIVESVSGQSLPPAFGISLEQAETALAGYSVQGGSLRLPTPTEWEYACKAGESERLFAWGNQYATRIEIERHAVLAISNEGKDGPRNVGTRNTNPYGLYDMHGNVWELTSDGSVRGGSWADPLAQARAANRQDLDATLPHPLVGMRPVLMVDP